MPMQRCSTRSAQRWKPAPNRQLIEVDAHINDPAFAEAAVHAFRDITRGH